MPEKTKTKTKKGELPYLPIFIASSIVVIGGAITAAVLLSRKQTKSDPPPIVGGGGGDGGGIVDPTDPPEVTLPPGSIVVNKTCYSAPNTEQLAEGCKELPVKGFPFQYVRRTCTPGPNEFTGEGCWFSDCANYTGGLRTNTDEQRYQDVPAPQRVTCYIAGLDECACSTGCADGWNEGGTNDRLCLKPDATVQYGAAKGVNEMDCPYLFCYQWDNNQQDWVGVSRQNCSKICIPELYLNYETLGDNITVEEQLSTLGGFRFPNYTLESQQPETTAPP